MSKFITAIVALACMAPSMAINAIHQFEHTPGLMAWPLAGAAVLSVLLAGCSPFAMEAALKGRRWLALSAAVLAGLVCVAYNLASAVGAASVARSEVSGTRAQDNRRAELLTGQLAQAEKSRAALAVTAGEQTPDMVDKSLQALKQSPIWTRSKECADATLPNSRTFCADYAQKLAVRDAAAKVAELDASISGLKTQLLAANAPTVGRPADPQAENIGVVLAMAGLHPGPHKIGLGLNLWFALTIEVLGSLGPIVLAHAFGRAEATHKPEPTPGAAVEIPAVEAAEEAKEETQADGEDAYTGLHLVSEAEPVKQPEPAPGSVDGWLLAATCDAPGSELRGGDALKAYRRWAGDLGKDMDAPKFRRLVSRALACQGRGKIINRNNGFVLANVALKSANVGGDLGADPGGNSGETLA